MYVYGSANQFWSNYPPSRSRGDGRWHTPWHSPSDEEDSDDYYYNYNRGPPYGSPPVTPETPRFYSEPRDYNIHYEPPSQSRSYECADYYSPYSGTYSNFYPAKPGTVLPYSSHEESLEYGVDAKEEDEEPATATLAELKEYWLKKRKELGDLEDVHIELQQAGLCAPATRKLKPAQNKLGSEMGMWGIRDPQQGRRVVLIFCSSVSFGHGLAVSG